MKKTVAVLVKLIIIFACLFGVNALLKFALVDDRRDDEFRGAMETFHAQEDIDVLFLGSSHVFCGVNPFILSDKWGENVYLGASSMQKPDVSYYMLKEALRKNDIKKVYLDMYYLQFREENTDGRDAFRLKYIYGISDYMYPSFDRTAFILDAVPREQWIRAFLPTVRYSDRIFDFEYIDEVVKSKRSTEGSLRENKGFFTLYGDITPANADRIWIDFTMNWEQPTILKTPVNKYSKKYLDRIVKLCKQENIELILFTTPMSEYHLNIMQNYDEYYRYISQYAEANGIQFLDFNMMNPDYHVFSSTSFGDTHHLNRVGADEFSEVLGDVVTKINNGVSKDSFFKESIDDKMSKMNGQIFGVLIEEVSEGEFEITPVTNSNQLSFEYKVEIAPATDGTATEEYSVLSDFDSSNRFAVSREADFNIIVSVRVNGDQVFVSNELPVKALE